MKIDGEPGNHTYKFEEMSGLYTWRGHNKVWIMKPHLKVTCIDCGWTETFEFKKKKLKLDLTHPCTVPDVVVWGGDMLEGPLDLADKSFSELAVEVNETIEKLRVGLCRSCPYIGVCGQPTSCPGDFDND